MSTAQDQPVLSGVRITEAEAAAVDGQDCPACGQKITKQKAQYGYAMACPSGCSYAGIKAAPRGKPFQSPGNQKVTIGLTPKGQPIGTGTNGSGPVTAKVTPKPTVKAPSGYKFPFQQAYELAEAVRKALAAGSTGLTFGHRKLENWATLTAKLHRSGFATGADALSLAYHMTVVAREVDSNRRFAVEMFEGKFAKHPKTEDPCRPFTEVIDFAVAENLPLYLTGEPGVGKTYTILDALRRAGLNPIRVQGSGELVKADVEGSMGYVEGVGTVWTDGSAIIAARQGRPFVFDEIDKARDDVQSVFVAALESHDGSLTISATGERVVPASGFGIFGTGNTVGLGEGVRYEGTRIINEAIRDRFYFLKVGYMTPAMAKRLVEAQLADLGATIS